MDQERVLGIDVGGTGTKLALVDREGRVGRERQLATASFVSFEGFVAALVGELAELVQREGPVTVRGIGIGAPNGNGLAGTIESAPNLPWKGRLPLADSLGHRSGLPVSVTNDANAAALGEGLYGGAVGLDDFLVVTLGTGLGSGFVCGGELLVGATGLAGELGHVIVEPDGRPCGCGRRGCLETYASATGLVRTVRDLLAEDDRDSALRAFTPRTIEARDVDEAARDGDALALEAFAECGRVLGLALANAVAITSPAAVFLFGGLADAGERILEPTRKAFEEHLLPVYRGTVQLRLSALLDRNAAILGAAALAWRHCDARPS
ncbi:MAG: ROK family protein [Planctomycetota bacterium]